VLGHRGASAHAQENTLEAFRLAAEQGADGIETDLRHTADGVIVLHHDAEVDGVGDVATVDFSILRAARPEVPTLDELLAVHGDLLLNLEIKSDPRRGDYDPSHRIAAEVAAWISRHHLHARTVVSSFDPAMVDAVAAHDPSITTGQLLDHRVSVVKELASVKARGHQYVLPHVSRLRIGARVTIEATHEAGLAIGVWTVDRPATLRRLAAAGIDALITNDPKGARQAIDGTNSDR
jgi:glycerophosphoryl diester phosphodiesterase